MFRKFSRILLLTSILLLVWSWLKRKSTNLEEPIQKGPKEIEVPLQVIEGFVPGRLIDNSTLKEKVATERIRKPDTLTKKKAEGESPQDDLRLIEGIGPKISQVLYQAGITTYSQLAGMSAEDIKGVLNASGIRIAQPDTWPQQANLAAKDDWEGLKSLQAQLKAGQRK